MDYKELKRLIGMLKLGDDLTSYAKSKLMSFIKKQEAEQLILSSVSKRFTEKQMEESFNDGISCEKQRCGYFDVDNYK